MGSVRHQIDPFCELSVNLLGGFIPTSGSTFEVLTAIDGFVGTFDTETLPTLGGILEWTVDYGATAVTLQAFLVGDFDEDGDVHGADFLVWQRDDGTPAGLAAWQATYGSGVGSLQAATTVPEPVGLSLALVSLGLFAVARRR